MNGVVVIGASAGGVAALTEVLAGLPGDFPAPVLIVMHIGDHPSVLPAILSRSCALPVRHAAHGETLAPGMVLVAPPGRHLMVERDGDALRAVLVHGPRENHSRPAIDPLFRSAAIAYAGGAAGVILTGFLDDGVAGLAAIKTCGGTAIVQDPADASASDMPRNALEQVEVDRCLPLAGIAGALVEWAAGLPERVADGPAQAPEWLTVENRFASGGGEMKQLKRIATPSPYTCPECGGSLFSLNNAKSCRFRCHTGHSYTLLSLLREQEEAIEAALSKALRAVQEKESLAEQLAAEFSARSVAPEPGYAALAQQARAEAEALRALLTGGK
ncbi:chemotaxis protein CheB [Oxalobacteraceae bacterium OTU3CINTB1]|nr:chemotaxis protein CheB [Oxalobacteraceae bacterium OTU3CINTB1]